jgi:hypothetical protein
MPAQMQYDGLTPTQHEGSARRHTTTARQADSIQRSAATRHDDTSDQAQYNHNTEDDKANTLTPHRPTPLA